MEEFRSNSNRSREGIVAKNPDKKVEKVISGTAKTKKKTETKKFADAFIKDDIGNIGSYILVEVLIPAIKKTILESVKAVLGETGSSHSVSASKVSYRSYYDREPDRRTQYNSIPARGGFDYDDIIFETHGDAEAVLDGLNDIINSQYGVASVGDLYDLANISTDNYTVNNYGWADLRGCKVIPTRDGYMLKLPRALPLR